MTSKEIDPKGQRVSAFCLCSLFSSFVYFVSSLFPSVLFVLLIILSGLFVLILFFVLFVLSCLFCLLRFICMYIYIYIIGFVLVSGGRENHMFLYLFYLFSLL